MSLEAWGDDGDVEEFCPCCEGDVRSDGECAPPTSCVLEERQATDDAGHQVLVLWCTFHDREVNP